MAMVDTRTDSAHATEALLPLKTILVDDEPLARRGLEIRLANEADIRIAFEQGDGSWSYLGTDIRTRRSDPRTMNFGWSLVEDPQEGMDTAIHEIGHTLAFPHEHQNPFAGIVWDEEAVYRSLAAPPNSWSRQTTFHNIIRKIEPDTVKGSNWDPDSVMHYPFEAGLILKPAKYSKGLSPAGGLSPHDREWVQTLYPPLKAADAIPLVPFQSVPLKLKSGQQVDFSVSPTRTRPYVMQTFGEADTVMALFEQKPSGAVQLAARPQELHRFAAGQVRDPLERIADAVGCECLSLAGVETGVYLALARVEQRDAQPRARVQRERSQRRHRRDR